MASFSHQARWNFFFSVLAQAVAVLFIAIASRLMGHAEFGYYIWITALPGMIVVFDLYLGLSLQNRLTELFIKRRKRARDRLIWGFIWGMLAAAVLFVSTCVLTASLVAHYAKDLLTSVPADVIWLGVVQAAAVAIGVPFLVASLGFNAAGQIHRGAAWTFTLDLSGKIAFLVVLAVSGSLGWGIVALATVMVTSSVVMTARFMHLFKVPYIAPSLSVVRSALRQLWVFSNGRDWAFLRVADGLLKNSELVIGAFVIGSVTIGEFAVLDRLSNALMLAANSAYLVMAPFLVAAGASGDGARMASLTRKVGRFSIVSLVLFSVVFLTSGEFIASVWAGRAVDFPLLVVVLICVRAWTRVLSSFYWNILFGYKLIRGLLWATAASGAAYAILYGALIWGYGVLAILVSQIAAQLVFMAMAGRMQARHHAADLRTSV